MTLLARVEFLPDVGGDGRGLRQGQHERDLLSLPAGMQRLWASLR